MYAYIYTHVLTHFIQSAGGFVEISVRRRRRWWRSQTGPAFGCRVGGGGGGIRPLACSPLGGLPLHPVGQEEVVTRGLVAAMVGAMDGGISIGTWPVGSGGGGTSISIRPIIGGGGRWQYYRHAGAPAASVSGRSLAAAVDGGRCTVAAMVGAMYYARLTRSKTFAAMMRDYHGDAFVGKPIGLGVAGKIGRLGTELVQPCGWIVQL